MYVHQLSYRHQKNAPYFFKNISFELAPGKMHALHGKNGMGKSVLLNLLARKKDPLAIVEGEIRGIENAAIINQRFDQMIADQFSFDENLKFSCMPSFPNPFAPLKKGIFHLDLLEQFHINPYQPVHKLSGGQRQILALLMGLQQRKNILLLDEPTATLDEQNARLVFEFLKTLITHNVTFLVVCHDQELIHSYANGKHLHLEMDGDGSRRLRC